MNPEIKVVAKLICLQIANEHSGTINELIANVEKLFKLLDLPVRIEN